MAERRSLTSAVQTSTAHTVDPNLVRSFVTQSQQPELNQVTTKSAPSADQLTSEDASSGVMSKYKSLVLEGSTRKLKRLTPVGLIPVTIRLQPVVAGALKRASLERELAGEDVYTQQEIVENALRPWLRNEGFLD